MNKYDLILCISIIVLVIIYGLFRIDNHNDKEAIVYYDNDSILKIDMNIDNTYEVNGYNGLVKIEVVDHRIRVIEENSPKHLCSRQGFISNSYETIICLPNKIVIEIEDSIDIDTIVR